MPLDAATNMIVRRSDHFALGALDRAGAKSGSEISVVGCASWFSETVALSGSEIPDMDLTA